MFMNGAKKFTEASERFKNLLKGAAKDSIETMDSEELEAYQSIIQAIDAMDDVIAEQQEALKTIDNKLDELNRLLLAKGVV